MNKQEMAEFLAEKVLKAKKSAITGLANVYWFKWDDGRSDKIPMIAEKFIYSPAGFFAVWDAFISKYQYMVEFVMLKHESHECFLTKFFINDSPICGAGKDRYEAFYNAVYEVVKDE